jgi:hypothetical protein
MKVHRLLKLSSLKKIIAKKFTIEYNLYPIFEELYMTMYKNDMKIEMFCGEIIKGYLLEIKELCVAVLYKGGQIELKMQNYENIAKLKKKICRMYGLGLDVAIIDQEGRMLDRDLILEKYFPNPLILCLEKSNKLINLEMNRIQCDIIIDGSIHNFHIVVCNAWNRSSVVAYINCLIGGMRKKMGLYIDGII